MAGPFRIEQRWAVAGGSLKRPWLPQHVVDCDGRPFVELKTADRCINHICDLASKTSVPLLNVLRHLRDQGVNDEILKHLKEADPLGAYETIPVFWRNVLGPDGMSQLPKTINVKVPPFDGPDGMIHGCEMTLLFDVRKVKPVTMEMTSDNLMYLREASKAIAAGNLSAESFGNCPKRRRLSQGERDFPSLESVVKYDAARKSLYVNWTNADGKKKRHFHKPKTWKAADVDATESDLVRWREANHHVANDDGTYELEYFKGGHHEASANVHEDDSSESSEDSEARSEG